jgi:hypothetical protein
VSTAEVIVLPIVRREPLPGDLQAQLDYRTRELVVNTLLVADCDVAAFRAEATLCLNGRRDLAAYVEPLPAALLSVLPDGAQMNEAS